MEQAQHQQILASLEGLTAAQIDALLQTLRERQDADGVQRLIMARMAQEGCCPRCQSTHRYKHGIEFGAQRFRCKDCGKTYTATTGTPFHRLRDKTKLLENAACMADGLSVRKTAARLGVSVQKAFRWRHKFLAFLNQQKPSALSGIVEADETFFPVSYKGQRKALPRSPKKRGGKAKDGSGSEKTAVVVAVQRGTQVAFDQVLERTTGTALTEALLPVLGADAVLSTDGNAAYWTVADKLKVESGFFVAQYHGKGGKGPWHVQSVNRYDSSLKSWMARFSRRRHQIPRELPGLAPFAGPLQGPAHARTVSVSCAADFLSVRTYTVKENSAPLTLMLRNKRGRVCFRAFFSTSF